MTLIELVIQVVAALAHALALAAILMSIEFLALLLWNRLMPLVATASLGADQIGRPGVRRVLCMLCRTRRTRTKRPDFGDGQAPGRGGEGGLDDVSQN